MALEDLVATRTGQTGLSGRQSSLLALGGGDPTVPADLSLSSATTPVRTPGRGGRALLSAEQSARVRSFLMRTRTGHRGTWWSQVAPSTPELVPPDPLAPVARGLGGAATLASLAGGVIPSLRPIGSGLGLAAGGVNLARGIERGRPLTAASGGVGLVGGAAGLLNAAKIAPAVTGPLKAATGPASLGLGLAAHDPGAVISGAAGSVLGGMALAGAANPAALAVSGGLSAIPALGILAGDLRSASIEKGYRQAAKRAIGDLRANPILQNPGPTLQAIARGGNAGLLADLVAQAVRTGQTVAQPEGGTPYGVYGSVTKPIFEWYATNRPQDYGSFLVAVADRIQPGIASASAGDEAFYQAWKVVRGAGAPAPAGLQAQFDARYEQEVRPGRVPPPLGTPSGMPAPTAPSEPGPFGTYDLRQLPGPRPGPFGTYFS